MADIERQTMNRNSTNFAIGLFEKLKTYKFDNEYQYLFYYQYIVTKYITNIDIKSRGLLIYHTMGMGKSILAVALAMALRDNYEPIVLLTKSLEANFRDSIVKFLKMAAKHDEYTQLGNMPVDDIKQWINRNFSFVSMNASNMIKQITRATEARADVNSKDMERRIGNIVKLGSLDGKILIIDEAHNLFRAIINGSKNGVELYDMIMRAKDAKIVFLTGTPVSNHPFELVPCFNMLVGTTMLPVLPENWDDFNAYFIDSRTNSIRNKAKFQNRIMGLVSYITHTSKPGDAADISVATKSVEFPTALETKVIEVPMGNVQYVKYLMARDKELTESKGFSQSGDMPNLQKPKSAFTSSYRVRSRQLSNYSTSDTAADAMKGSKDPHDVPAGESESPKFKAIRENMEGGVGTDLVYSQFIGIGGIGMFAQYLTHSGYSEYKLAGAKSPRRVTPPVDVTPQPLPTDDIRATEEIASLQHRATAIETKDGLVVEGSNDWYDSDDYGSEDGDDSGDSDDSGDGGDSSRYIGGAKKTKVEANKPKAAEPKVAATKSIKKSNVFALIMGNVDPQDRNNILQIFNSDENKHGAIISVLLISSTGAEGLDGKNIRRVHVMEPYWNYSRIAQVIARAVRNDSHLALPKEEKFVQPFVYIAIPPLVEGPLPDEVINIAKKSQGDLTTDQDLFQKSLTTQTLVDDFTTSIKEVSIECMLNGESYCRVCSPTNLPLYSNNILLDLKSTDPCVRAVEKTVTASEVEINGDKYFYKSTPASVFGYTVFVHDEELNTFRNMREDNPLFQKIVKEIKKHESSTKKRK